nr:hypothetical protein [Tanacetum cinerariifolium]
MNLIATQQAALDNDLVPSEKRLNIERCNARITFSKPQKEETYQVTLEALKLSPCYPTFVITFEVLEIYMHQFWNTIKKIRKTNAYNFKLDKKECRVDTKKMMYFHLLGNLVTLATVKCFLLFVLIKYTSLGGRLLLSLTSVSLGKQQDLTGLGNHELKSCTLKFVSKTKDCQKYGALILDGMINDDIKLSAVYKTYLDYATGRLPPKMARVFKKHASSKLKTFPISPKEPTQKGKRVKRPSKKATTTLTTVVVISDTPGKSLKKTLRKSKQETHRLQASGSSERADFKSKVPDEQTGKTKDTSKGTGVKPGVLDVSKEDSSDSDDDSWVTVKMKV